MWVRGGAGANAPTSSGLALFDVRTYRTATPELEAVFLTFKALHAAPRTPQVLSLMVTAACGSSRAAGLRRTAREGAAAV